MKNPFKSYRKEFDTACQVMKGMAEEIIRLRREVKDLREERILLNEENDELREEANRNADIAEAQGERIKFLLDNQKAACMALARVKK